MRIGHMSARKGVTAAVLTVAGIVALTTTSLALFTETETVGANTFSVGTIDLTAAPTSAAITFSAMAPGDQVTAALTITNAGTLELRYAVTSTTTENVLAAQLDSQSRSESPRVLPPVSAPMGRSSTQRVIWGRPREST